MLPPFGDGVRNSTRYNGPDYSMGFAHTLGHYFFYHFFDRILWKSMQLILIWIEGKVHFLILSDQIIRPLVFKPSSDLEPRWMSIKSFKILYSTESMHSNMENGIQHFLYLWSCVPVVFAALSLQRPTAACNKKYERVKGAQLTSCVHDLGLSKESRLRFVVIQWLIN